MITKYPEEPCTMCYGSDFWFRQKEQWSVTPPPEPDEWVCSRCHPSGDALPVLKYRVVRGNFVMHQVRQKMWSMEDNSPEQVRALAKYAEGYAKLQRLCELLKAQGATECLYITGGKKMKKCMGDAELQCTVCPNEYWWEKELLAFDKQQHPEE